jgi:hypothetical protein
MKDCPLQWPLLLLGLWKLGELFCWLIDTIFKAML